MRTIAMCFLALLALPFAASAQGLNSDGRDFYIGMLYPSLDMQGVSVNGRDAGGYFHAYAIISSYQDNLVGVGYFDDMGNEVNRKQYKVAAHRSIQVPLDVDHMKPTQPGEQVEWKSCHITARSAVNVQYYSTGVCSGGSYLALPTSALGRHYVVESYRDNVAGVGGMLSHEDASGYFLIIAPFDGTEVQITPSSTTKQKRPGVSCGPGSNGKANPFFIGLNVGQTYMVKSDGHDPSCDISGTTIVSDKPVAVIAGHENAFTDSSDRAPGISEVLEGRDFMVEQMLPVEYWDTTGLVSIPFQGSEHTGIKGQGDGYHLFSGILPEVDTSGPASSQVVLEVQGTGTPLLNQPASPYANPVPSVAGIVAPVSAYSTNGTKLHLVQYGERRQLPTRQSSAPSQLLIIPQSRWKSSYLAVVPNDPLDRIHAGYVSVVCNRSDFDKQKYKVSVDARKPNSLVSSDSVWFLHSYPSIPDHPDLAGYTFGLRPGTYYFSADSDAHPFGLYSYGDPAMDVEDTFITIDTNEFFTSYANPNGFVFKGDGGKLSVKVDTLCASWHVCVHDGRKPNWGVKLISILDDPNGDIVKPGRKYSNVALDRSVDPWSTNEILGASDSDYCFDVLVSDPFKSAYAPVAITDNGGSTVVFELRYKAPAIAVASDQWWGLFHDSVLFQGIHPLDSACATISYRNTNPQDSPSITLQMPVLRHGNTPFRITKIVPSLPAKLAPGDSAAITICVSSADTAFYSDTLDVTTGCLTQHLGLFGLVGVPLLVVDDHDFGKVKVGQQACALITLRNVGRLSVTLFAEQWNGSTAFSDDPHWQLGYPYSLGPGDTVTMSVCFKPHGVGPDSATLTWLTFESGPFKDSLKSFSVLRGSGYGPSGVPGVSQAQTVPVASIIENRLHVTLPERMRDGARFELYDVLGRAIFTWAGTSVDPESGRCSLAMPRVAGGMYVLRVSAGGVVASCRVIQ